MKDLEELLEKERKERKRLEEERTRMGETIRGILGEEVVGEGDVKG